MKINSRWLSLGLSAAGCAGVGITSWLSIRGHEKAKEKKSTKEKLLCYWKAGLSGLLTCGCIMGSHGVNRKEIAKLGGALAIAAANKDKIEKVVRQQFGEKKLQEVKQEVGREMIKYDPAKVGVCYEYTGYGNKRFLFYEQGRYFCASDKAVFDAERKIERMLQEGIVPTWNDFYELLNIEQTRWGMEYILPDDSGKWDLNMPIEFQHGVWQDSGGKDVTLIYLVDGRERVTEDFDERF